jgi:hypothetical protein
MSRPKNKLYWTMVALFSVALAAALYSRFWDGAAVFAVFWAILVLGPLFEAD